VGLALLVTTASAAAQSRDISLEAMRAEKRVALVIGNATYATSPLRNPVNDARAMAQTLKNVGFDVIARENANEREMKRAINEFGDRLRGGGVGVFFFAGHGMQVGGRNFLIPIGAEIQTEADVDVETIDVNRVLARMEGARNRLNIVILDACRDNPFARGFRSTTRGLGSIDAPSGTLIAYATAPGRVARDGEGANGLYTGELLRAMREPGLRVEELFKSVRAAVRQKTNGEQVPWEASSVEGDFIFALRASGPTAAISPRPEPRVESPDPGDATRDEARRLRLEQQRLDEERQRLESEKRLFEERRSLQQERERLEAEKRRFEAARQKQLEDEAPRIAIGRYRVQGTNPNGNTYQGTLTLERSGSLYLLQWRIGRDTFQGQGTLSGRTLTIDWGQADPVVYQVMNDGTLQGTWARGQGKETLFPER
jgi:uncharacterized caspase-like protein